MNSSPSSPIENSILFERMFNNAGLTSMLVLDLKGIVVDVNSGFLHSFGYSRDFLIGKNFSCLFIEEDKRQKLPERELEETIEIGSSSDNNYLLRGDGFPIWVQGESVLTEDTTGRRFIIKIVQDTHIEKVLEEELMKKKLEQEKIIKDRNLFIHTVSHDLKSPVSNIQGLVNGLAESLDDPEELAVTLQLLGQSVERLTDKISELATIGRAQEEQTIATADIDFHQALSEVLLDLEDEIQRSGAEIVSDFSGAPVVHFSKKNLKSILQNLISNSVKF